MTVLPLGVCQSATLQSAKSSLIHFPLRYDVVDKHYGSYLVNHKPEILFTVTDRQLHNVCDHKTQCYCESSNNRLFVVYCWGPLYCLRE